LQNTCLVATKTGKNIAVKAIDILPQQRTNEYQYSYLGIPVPNNNKKLDL
jgi:hypothetical protein